MSTAGGIFGQRFAGSLGNPAYLGSYMLFSLFFAGFLISGKGVKFGERLALISLSILFFAFFLFAQTRGAFLGLIVSVVVFLLFYAFKNSVHRRSLIITALILTLLFSTLIYFRESPAIKNMPVIGRLLRVSVFDRSVQSRLWVWQTAYEGWKERPILGWGPENFTKVFNNRFDIWHFVKQKIQSALFFAFPVAYLIQGIVLFEILPIYLPFFFFLAFSVYRFQFAVGGV